MIRVSLFCAREFVREARWRGLPGIGACEGGGLGERSGKKQE
jgi:hypothetical protein